MRFHVIHTTRHTYSKPVFLETHALRLRPRSDASQRLIDFRLEIDPQPVMFTEAIGPEGDPLTYAWFQGTTPRLVVRSEFAVETLRVNPFDYLLLEARHNTLPMNYGQDLKPQLAPFLSPLSPHDGAVARFARSIAEESNQSTLRFLSLLNERIYAGWEVGIREEGDAYPPERTYETRAGACRDVAVLFMDCCRILGLAARFVSGYQEGDRDARDRYMHAWSEVFLPGAGWRGYDPTHGLAVSDRHIAVASAADSRFTAPISGAFRGNAVRSTMEVEMLIQVDELASSEVSDQGQAGLGKQTESGKSSGVG